MYIRLLPDLLRTVWST